MQWYVLRVQSNKEIQVKDTLFRKIESEGLSDVVGRIEVPVERVKRIRGNKQTVHNRRPQVADIVYVVLSISFCATRQHGRRTSR